MFQRGNRKLLYATHFIVAVGESSLPLTGSAVHLVLNNNFFAVCKIHNYHPAKFAQADVVTTQNLLAKRLHPANPAAAARPLIRQCSLCSCVHTGRWSERILATLLFLLLLLPAKFTRQCCLIAACCVGAADRLRSADTCPAR